MTFINISESCFSYIIPCLSTQVLGIHVNKWKLDLKLGVYVLLLYAVFLCFSILIEYNIFTFVNLPMCQEVWNLWFLNHFQIGPTTIISFFFCSWNPPCPTSCVHCSQRHYILLYLSMVMKIQFSIQLLSMAALTLTGPSHLSSIACLFELDLHGPEYLLYIHRKLLSGNIRMHPIYIWSSQEKIKSKQKWTMHFRHIGHTMISVRKDLSSFLL